MTLRLNRNLRVSKEIYEFLKGGRVVHMHTTVHEVMDCISFALTIFSSSINIGKWIAKRNTKAEHRETEENTDENKNDRF